MEKKKMLIPKTLILALLAFLGAVGIYLGSYEAGLNTPPNDSLGAEPGATFPDHVTIGGLAHVNRSVGLGAGTSTYSIAGPGATSTLASVLCDIRTGSSTTGEIDLYKGTAQTSTATPWFIYAFPLQGKSVLYRWSATNTDDGTITTGLTSTDLLFGASSTLTIDLQGVTGSGSGGRFFGSGQCAAEWRSLSPIFSN